MNPAAGAATTTIEHELDDADLAAVTATARSLPAASVVEVLQRLDRTRRAVLYRLLSKQQALQVFEALDPRLQSDLVAALQHDDVAALFAAMDPDDRVELLDELPASVARRLLQGLPAGERELTADILGYPQGSVGRRMSPEFIALRQDSTVQRALARVRAHLDDAETVYALPVIDASRTLVGMVGLRDLVRAEPSTTVAELMQPVDPASMAYVGDAIEESARRCAGLKVLALPVTDGEGRLVGILTIDDALRILESAATEDQARIGGTEPLRRPYLASPVRTLVRSRVVWLLILAVGDTLTVQVQELFKATLNQAVALALFVPLLIGTGGNTGNQAATTVTRALALGDIGPRDIVRVMTRELRVGALLGLLLGSVAFVVGTAIYGNELGTVLGLSLLTVCTVAATVGGAMPLLARALHADPAVFSNPFISTFVDATGLMLYFLIAKAVLGI